jgi:outer membrane protein OmpA-like peptidoglycan-associated protein
MKKRNVFACYVLLAGLACTLSTFARAQVTDPKTTAGQSASDHVNNNVSNGINNSLDKAENGIKGLFKKKNKGAKTDTTKVSAANAPGAAGATAAAGDAGSNAPVSLKTYNNYDFVPGDQIIFDDNFADDADGEFPTHWSLEKGQAVVNKVNGVQAFCLTEGNYVQVSPRMKTTDNYLPDNFTIEFDFFPNNGSYTPGLLFGSGEEGTGQIFFGKEVSTSYFGKDFSAAYPGDVEHFEGKWHHAAMIRKGNQMKCYVDQYRVLVMPDVSGTKVTRLNVGGIGSTEAPIVFKNFRIAAGGNMNMIGKKFTDNKIVTHGINFDVDKATIRPEAMGTLNMIVGVMKDNPDIRFEIDGHTDNSGPAAHNLTLSQQRADAVKTELVSLGIDASRLTTKAFGDTKPISDNSSPEGKANNRRIEFVKM